MPDTFLLPSRASDLHWTFLSCLSTSAIIYPSPLSWKSSLPPVKGSWMSPQMLCPMSESLSGKREGLQDNATRKKGSLLLTRVRAPATSNAVVRGQRAPSPSCYTNLQGEHKQWVAGLSGLVTCLQRNFIGPNFCRLFSNLGFRGVFQLSPDRFPFSYWVHIDWLAPGGLMGVVNLNHFRGNLNLGPGCLSWCQPLQPHSLPSFCFPQTM